MKVQNKIKITKYIYVFTPSPHPSGKNNINFKLNSLMHKQYKRIIFTNVKRQRVINCKSKS